MYLSTPGEQSKFATADGASFTVIAQATLPDFVDFLATRVLVLDDEAGELPVPIGTAAELKAQADAVENELARLLLALVSQDFDAAHKLPLTAETEREQARMIIERAETRELSVLQKQAVYDLVARTLIRCGHVPAQVSVPETRLLTPDEILELWVWYRLGKPVADVDKLVGRWQAAHNARVKHLLVAWGVVRDLNLRVPLTPFEAQCVRPIRATPPDARLGYESNDIPQTGTSNVLDATTEDATATDEAPKVASAMKPADAAKAKSRPRAKKAPLPGPPKPRLSPFVVTFIGSEERCKSSLILDITICRLEGIPRAAKITPGLHAQAFARRSKGKGRPARTRQTPGFDFEIATDNPLFGGRRAIALTIKDIDGTGYHADTFGASECQNGQSTDALIVPIDAAALKDGAEMLAAEDALFLARVAEQYRYRPGLPIAIAITACDKLMTEAEVAAVTGCRLFPVEFQRRLLTSVTTSGVARLHGTAAERMRQAAFQNPGVAISLNVLRVIDRLFTRYEPLFREAVAITGAIEVFFTVTSTKESGWSRTYGSVEVIEWVARELESQIRPILAALVAREQAHLAARQIRVTELLERVSILDAQRENLRQRQEANTTARFVWWWNKPARLQAQDKEAEAAVLVLLGEIEAVLALKAPARATPATRRAAIAGAEAELSARIRALDGV